MIADRVAEFVAEKRRRKRPATYERYHDVLERVLLPWCDTQGITGPEQLTAKVMDALSDYLQQRPNVHTGKPLSIVTVHSYLNHIRVFLDWCEVPRGRFEMPHLPQRIVDTLTGPEIDRLERVADTERDRLIVRVLADTGIRISELLGLTKGDLHANTHEREYFINVIGKGDKEREVPIPKKTFERLAAYAASIGGGYIFRHLDRHYAAKLTARLREKAGFEDRRIHPHLLRHTYVTDQLRAGMHPEKLRVIMGWNSTAMLRVYSHVVSADGYKEAMAGLRARDHGADDGDGVLNPAALKKLLRLADLLDSRDAKTQKSPARV